MIGKDVESLAGEQPARLSDLVRSVRGILQRRWITLVTVSVAIFILSVIVIFLMTPKYDATTRIRIDPSRNPMSSVQNQVQADLGSEAIETEVGVFQSPDLAREVVRRLNLQEDLEFTKGIDGRDRPSGDDQQHLNDVADSVMRHLSVSREKLSYIIAVRFQSKDAGKAARIANAFAETYLDTRVGTRMGTATRQAGWFKQRLDAMAADVHAADAQVAQYRSQAGIVQGGTNGTIADQQVGPLSEQLATAESDAAAARSALAAAQGQITRGNLDAITEVRGSPVITDLRRQRAEVQRNKDEIDARYGPKYPDSIKAREQLSSLDRQISDEANRVVSSLKGAADAANARVGSLRSAMHSLEDQQARNSRAAVTAQSLEQDAQAKRAAYDRMSQISLESTQASRNSIAQAEIVDRAQAPSLPTSPHRKVLAVFGLVAGIAVAMAVVIVQEMLVGGLRSIADIESRLGIPVLASLPKAPKSRRKGGDTALPDLVVQQPASMFAEALRNARTSILGMGSAVKVVALTSALPAEGKTTTALSLARVLAMSGQRILIIDCDVRRAKLRQMTDGGTGVGLVEVLQGKATAEEAIVADKVNGLDLLTVRESFFSAEDLFGGERMAGLLKAMKQRYDAVLLDLPPLMGVADARVLAGLADAVALIVRWGKTPVPAVESSLSWLHADRANVVGAIYTMVEPTSEAVGGLYYSKAYAAYYQSA
jgi:capsular exopolysaccharide synthesis family protein